MLLAGFSPWRRQGHGMAPYGAEAAGFDLGGLFHFGPSRFSRATAAGVANPPLGRNKFEGLIRSQKRLKGRLAELARGRRRPQVEAGA
jgi:hypothetical protein